MTRPQILTDNLEFFLCRAAENPEGVVDVRSFMEETSYEGTNGDEIWQYSVGDLLFREGANPFELDTFRNCAPVMLAARSGNWDSFIDLLNAMETQPNYQLTLDYKNRSLLHCAAIGSNPHIIHYVLSNLKILLT